GADGFAGVEQAEADEEGDRTEEQDGEAAPGEPGAAAALLAVEVEPDVGAEEVRDVRQREPADPDVEQIGRLLAELVERVQTEEDVGGEGAAEEPGQIDAGADDPAPAEARRGRDLGRLRDGSDLTDTHDAVPHGGRSEDRERRTSSFPGSAWV